ncbi:hypothetical protein Rsub_07297 [Raphidocelis subcapitata]|uniref:CS domain-containing protein n=1 Tax=Raphidocelis subcapitata TaxID=307507 RepID=A0A2V0P366_9CHLO|nr:hypothetical protein Rsub_07297 [Raphidocelis subcapitata]|eukprot:GBF94029.1 hypothetical protein Rsub_07297 [Raphidocelis subcapitata]
MAAKTPNVLWAQRPNCVYVTIDVQDVKDPKVELSNDADGKHARVQFDGKTGEGTSYSLDLQLYGAVDKDKSKFNTMPRNIVMVLEKTEAGSWPRLTKESAKGDKHIKVDWDKWVDSDEEAAEDFDMSGMGGFGGGMGGMPGMEGMGGMGGMGGMPGMPGMGGMGGMDLQQLMASMGGGMGGPGGMDMMGGGEEGGDSDDDGDGDDDELPPLEEAAPGK